MKKTKTKLFLILAAAFAVCLGLALFACTSGERTESRVYDVGEEGVYYYDADPSTEYLMTLQSGVYLISLNGEKGSSGTYTCLEEEGVIRFTSDGGETFTASLADGAMKLSIEDTPYTFLRMSDCLVTFTDGEVTLSTQKVTYGRAAAEPASERDGYIFLGWYEDAAHTSRYGFDTAVTSDITVYAYYIEEDSTIENFEVDFVWDGGSYTTRTQNGVVYDFPKVDGIAGWWVSATNDPDELTYRYDGEILKEKTTLYAVEEGVLGTSVYGDKITWEGTASGVSVTIDGSISLPGTGNSLTYDLTSLGTGRHEVTVTAAGYNPETRVYVSNALARVSNFYVYGDVLVYNPVENAQYYRVSVTCGNPSHSHESVYNGTSLTYDFSECVMGADGISFTVSAYAPGFVESVSETFVYFLGLDEAIVTIDEKTDTASWNEVAGATGYEIYVGGEYVETVYGTTYSFKYFDIGTEITIAVKPVAPGHYSELSAEKKYEKATLRTPVIAEISEYFISWTEVEDAAGYEININGYIIDVIAEDGEKAPTKIYVGNSGADASEYYSYILDGVNVITVTALSSGGASDSQPSDALYVTELTMSPVLSYADGTVTWMYALAAGTYIVECDGATVAVDGKNSFDVTLTHSGENVVKVYFDEENKDSAYAEMTIYAYAVVFDSRGGGNVETQYVAKGDRVYTTEPSYEIGTATFVGWYTLPDLTGDENATGYEGDGTEFVSGTTFDYNGTLVLYACWVAQQISVTLYAGDGARFSDGESVKEVFIAYNSRSYTLEVPVSDDASETFLGWYSSEGGRGTQYADANGKATRAFNNIGVTALYAYWDFAVSYELTTYNGEKVLAASKGPAILMAENGEVTVLSSYTVDGTEYPVGLILADAFNDCTSLVTLNIPDTIMYIQTENSGFVTGQGAFAGCTRLRAVNVYETGGGELDPYKEVTYYSSDGVLFRKGDDDTLSLVYYPHAKPDTEYAVPATVENATEAVYDGASLVAVGPHTVTTITTRVFSAETGAAAYRQIFTKITLPGTITYVAPQAFSMRTNITSVTFLEAEAGSAGSLTIEDSAFEGCTSLTEVTLPSHMTSFHADAFAGCEELVSINITGTGGAYSSVDGIVYGDYGGAVVCCPKGHKGAVTIASSATTIEKAAFKDCVYVTSVVIPGSVTYIGESAFEGCTGLESVTFEGDDNYEDLTIATRAFYGCSNEKFTEISLPSNLIKMEAYAFGGTEHLTTVRVESRNNDDGTPADVSFAANSFATTSGVFYVENLYLGKYVPVISYSSIFGNKLVNIEIDPDNIFYKYEDGVLFSADYKTLISYDVTVSGGYTVPAVVETIGTGAFAGNAYITSVYIPSSVTLIESGAFSGCTNLRSVEFGATAGEDLVIEDEAFADTGIFTITLPARLTKIGTYASDGSLSGMSVFDGCSYLNSINVDDDCENFTAEDGILYTKLCGEADELVFVPTGCFGTTGTVIIPNTVTKVWAGAFSDTTLVKTVYFEDGTAVNGVEFGRRAFAYSGVTSLYIPVGTTAIPDNFAYGSGLTYVYIPYTVKTIDYYAFYSCSSLVTIEYGDVPEAEEGETQIVAPDLVFKNSSSVSAGQFGACTSLTEITFPDRTTTLQTGMFYGDHNVTKITIGANVESIPELFFLDLDNENLEIEFSGGEESKLKTIESYAFTGTSVKYLKIPENVETIETKAFSSHSQLAGGAPDPAAKIEEVVFNKNLKTIEDQAFYSCTSLTTITFWTPDDGETDCTLSLSIGKEAFGNTNITSVEYPYYVTTIGGFGSINKLESVTFADVPDIYLNGDGTQGVEGHTFTIGESAFASAKAFTGTLEIPSYVSVIGAGAFQGCTDITGLELPAILEEISSSAFYGCTGLTGVSLPASLVAIGSSAFQGCTALSAVAFDETAGVSGIREIGASAFSACTALTDFTFPYTVETIGASAFAGDAKLSSVSFSADENGASNLKEIGSGAFSGTALRSFAFPEIDLDENPDGITLGSSLFTDCSYLTTITLSNGVTDLGSALGGCYSISDIQVSESNKSYVRSSDGSPLLYTYDKSAIVYLFGETKGELTIEDGTKEIADGLFQYQNTLTGVSLPASVVAIGDYAFYGCTALTTVTMGEGSALETIGYGAFMYCQKLTAMVIPDSVTKIGDYAFYGDEKLETVTFGSEAADGVNSKLSDLGIYAFYKCESLKSIVIPAGVGGLYDIDNATKANQIYSYQFEYCSSLESVVFLGTPAAIGSYAFAYCTSLTTLGTGGTVQTGVIDLTGLAAATYFGNYAFAYSGVTNVYLGAIDFRSQINALCTSTFYDCDSLENISFSSGATYLTKGMFAGCDTLKSVIIPGNVVMYQGSGTGATGLGAFARCTSLTTVSSTESGRIEGVADLRNLDFATLAYGFYGCSALSTVLLPASCAVPTYCFYGCTALKTTVSDGTVNYTQNTADLSGVISIAAYAFATCGIENLVFPALATTTDSGTNIFYQCASLKTVEFDTVNKTVLNCSAFALSSISGTLVIPSTVTMTAGSAKSQSSSDVAKYGVFAWTNVETLIFEEGAAIGNYSFLGCSKLTTVLLEGNNSVGNYAFYDCESLTTLATLTGANYNADGSINYDSINEDMIDLTRVDYSDLGTNVFQYDSAVTVMVIPDTYTDLKNGMLSYMDSLTTVATLSADGNGDYDYTKIKESVVDISALTTTSIASNMFYQDYSIVTVVTSSTVSKVTLNANVFYECTSLKTLGPEGTPEGTVDLSNFSITGNSSVFQGCSNIEKVILPPTGTSVGSKAFQDCTSLKTVGMSDAVEEGTADLSGLKTVNSYSFAYTAVEKVILGNATSTSYYAQFQGCESLTDVTMTATVTLGKTMFADCTALTTVDFNNQSVTINAGTATTSYNRGAFDGCTSLTTLQNVSKVTGISAYTFYNCSSLSTFDFTSVTTVGNYAFYGCGLTSLDIPQKLTSIGDSAFAYCPLTAITVADGNSAFKAEDNLLLNYAGTSLVLGTAGTDGNVTVPNGVTSVGAYSFYGLESLRSVKLSSTVTSVGTYAFAESSLESAELNDGLTTIDAYAFYKSTLTAVTIPYTVTNIGNYAFAGDVSASVSGSTCTVTVEARSSLASVTFEDAPDDATAPALTLGTYVFAGSSLTGITIPGRTTSIGNYILAGTDGMETITVETGVTKLSQGFAASSGVKTVTIPGTCTELGSYAFWGCESLESLTLGEGLATVNDYAFMNCKALTTLTLPSTVTAVNTYAFAYCTSLENITFPSGVAVSVGTYAFAYCDGLKSVSIPSNVTLNNYTFAYSGLETVMVEEGVTTIAGNYVFAYTESLTSVTLPSTLTTISGTNAFTGSGLSSIVIGSGVTSIGKEAFSGCESITVYLEFGGEYETLHSLGNSNTSSTGTTLGYEDWRDGCEGTICYYSETEPSGTNGTYWHYDENGNPEIWNM